jgi:hypothetical protein
MASFEITMDKNSPKQIRDSQREKIWLFRIFERHISFHPFFAESGSLVYE